MLCVLVVVLVDMLLREWKMLWYNDSEHRGASHATGRPAAENYTLYRYLR